MWIYISLAFFSTWKFMFAPLTGAAAGLSFWETFIICTLGGFVSASIFYFGSNYFMQLSVKRNVRRILKAQQKGKIISPKKKFTKLNRRIISFKQTIGTYFLCWALPLFLSIPIGTIIVAKFYKHYRKTFPLIIMFLILDCFLITSGIFFIKKMII